MQHQYTQSEKVFPTSSPSYGFCLTFCTHNGYKSDKNEQPVVLQLCVVRRQLRQAPRLGPCLLSSNKGVVTQAVLRNIAIP